MRFDLGIFSGEVKARRSVEPVAVKKRHSGHTLTTAHFDQCLRIRGSFKEAECGAGMQFDIQIQFSVLSSRFSVKNRQNRFH
jgi:hypothetical protein